MSTVTIGIDPGKTGGMAVIEDGSLSVYKAPVTRDTPPEYDDVATWKLVSLIRRPAIAFIEIPLVSYKAKRTPSSMMSLYGSFAVWRAFLRIAKIPVREVPAVTWQAAMLGKVRRFGSKEVSVLTARQLWPKATITKRLADAVCIAEYGRQCGGMI